MKYWQRKKQERLYSQWAKHSELPPEAIPKFGEPDKAGMAGAPDEAAAAGMPAYTRPGRAMDVEYERDVSPGRDLRYLIEERGLWYRFRVLLVDLLRKLLRVD